ncbi:MAG: hypothetical protein MJ055_04785 [Phascolarctobacterium sp.]|nr:hypothetical protein [Phascolarctobacterium sp.]
MAFPIIPILAVAIGGLILSQATNTKSKDRQDADSLVIRHSPSEFNNEEFTYSFIANQILKVTSETVRRSVDKYEIPIENKIDAPQGATGYRITGESLKELAENMGKNAELAGYLLNKYRNQYDPEILEEVSKAYGVTEWNDIVKAADETMAKGEEMIRNTTDSIKNWGKDMQMPTPKPSEEDIEDAEIVPEQAPEAAEAEEVPVVAQAVYDIKAKDLEIQAKEIEIEEAEMLVEFAEDDIAKKEAKLKWFALRKELVELQKQKLDLQSNQ